MVMVVTAAAATVIIAAVALVIEIEFEQLTAVGTIYRTLVQHILGYTDGVAAAGAGNFVEFLVIEFLIVVLVVVIVLVFVLIEIIFQAAEILVNGINLLDQFIEAVLKIGNCEGQIVQHINNGLDYLAILLILINAQPLGQTLEIGNLFCNSRCEILLYSLYPSG